MAGCAGEATSAHLTATVQAARSSQCAGQHISSAVATVESFIVKMRATLAEQGLEPTALCARNRMLTRGANSAASALTPLETGIAADVSLINAAHTCVLKLSSTLGGDDRRRSVAEAEGDAGLAAAGADGAGDIGAKIAPLADLSDFSPVAGKSRALRVQVSGAEPS